MLCTTMAAEPTPSVCRLPLFLTVMLLPVARQVPLPEWTAGTPPQRKLRDFVGNLLERMFGFGKPPWQVRLMMREVLHPTDACRELVEDYVRPRFTLLVSILDEPGALMRLLLPFQNHGINLTRIESRPSRRRALWASGWPAARR